MSKKEDMEQELLELQTKWGDCVKSELQGRKLIPLFGIPFLVFCITSGMGGFLLSTTPNWHVYAMFVLFIVFSATMLTWTHLYVRAWKRAVKKFPQKDNARMKYLKYHIADMKTWEQVEKRLDK